VLTCGLPLVFVFVIFLLFIIAIFYLVIDFSIRYFTICDHRERIASTFGVERGFSGAMAACPTFFGIPKDNLATPQD
jgi:ABC-type sulfate transport system permease component